MAPQVLERNIALLFRNRKIVITFCLVELEHTPSSFPQSKTVINDWAISKEKIYIASSRRIIHVSPSQRDHHSKNNKTQKKTKSQQLNHDCVYPDLQGSRTKRFSLRELKTGSSSWITSTRLQAEISKLAWPRGSHPARGTRVYKVLAYFYTDYFDAGTPAEDQQKMGNYVLSAEHKAKRGQRTEVVDS